MTLSIVTGVCGSIEVTEQWFRETLAGCAQPRELVIVAQAETEDEKVRLAAALRQVGERGWACRYVSCPEPVGSSHAFNLGVQEATGDIVAMIHNDLMIHQPGWDASILAWFGHHPEAGVAGVHGATGFGAHDIYRTPYRLEQLARWGTCCNLEDAHYHGARLDKPQAVAVLDGMALIARRADLEAWGGLDEGLGPHHMYDADLCLRAMLDHGRVNYMLPISARHLNGQTANFPRYQEWAVQFGYDIGIHRTAHERFYEKWRGRLPVQVAS